MTKPEFRVWWIPQVPMKSFKVKVDNRAEGTKLLGILADYDQFQFDNCVKPDYCNAGGISMRHPEITEGEWWDVDDQSEWDALLEEFPELADFA